MMESVRNIDRIALAHIHIHSRTADVSSRKYDRIDLNAFFIVRARRPSEWLSRNTPLCPG